MGEVIVGGKWFQHVHTYLLTFKQYIQITLVPVAATRTFYVASIWNMFWHLSDLLSATHAGFYLAKIFRRSSSIQNIQWNSIWHTLSSKVSLIWFRDHHLEGGEEYFSAHAPTCGTQEMNNFFTWHDSHHGISSDILSIWHIFWHSFEILSDMFSYFFLAYLLALCIWRTFWHSSGILSDIPSGISSHLRNWRPSLQISNINKLSKNIFFLNKKNNMKPTLPRFWVSYCFSFTSPHLFNGRILNPAGHQTRSLDLRRWFPFKARQQKLWNS